MELNREDKQRLNRLELLEQAKADPPESKEDKEAFLSEWKEFYKGVNHYPHVSAKERRERMTLEEDGHKRSQLIMPIWFLDLHDAQGNQLIPGLFNHTKYDIRNPPVDFRP